MQSHNSYHSVKFMEAGVSYTLRSRSLSLDSLQNASSTHFHEQLPKAPAADDKQVWQSNTILYRERNSSGRKSTGKSVTRSLHQNTHLSRDKFFYTFVLMLSITIPHHLSRVEIEELSYYTNLCWFSLDTQSKGMPGARLLYWRGKHTWFNSIHIVVGWRLEK
jgi:hypothetical protein